MKKNKKNEGRLRSTYYIIIYFFFFFFFFICLQQSIHPWLHCVTAPSNSTLYFQNQTLWSLKYSLQNQKPQLSPAAAFQSTKKESLNHHPPKLKSCFCIHFQFQCCCSVGLNLIGLLFWILKLFLLLSAFLSPQLSPFSSASRLFSQY